MGSAERISTPRDDKRRSPAMRYVLPPVLVAVACLAVTAIVSLALRNQIHDQEQHHLQRETELAAKQIEVRFDLYAEQLFDIRPLFEGDANRTTRADFQSWVQVSGVFERLAGIQALSFVRVVASEDREEFEAAVRQDTSISGIGYPEFEVHPDSRASNLFVVDFIEPMERNEAAFGFDLGSQPDRLEAIETTRDTGDLAATAPITLVQETEDQKGMLLLLGVYDTPAVPTTKQSRRSSFTGVVSAVFRIDDMLAGALGDNPEVALRIYDVGPRDAEPLPLGEVGLRSDSDPSARTALQAVNSPDVATTEISIAGRRWLIVGEPTPALGLGQDASAGITLAVGIVLSLLIGGLVASLTYSRRNAESLVEHRTTELRTSERRLQALIGAFPDVLLRVRRDGTHVDYHLPRNAQIPLPFPAEDTVGKKVEEFLPPELAHRAQAALELVFQAGESVRMVLDLPGTGQALNTLEARLLRSGPDEATVVLRDVTKQIETQRLKDEFVSTVSHELRTPMTAIQGSLGLLSGGAMGVLPDDAQRLLDIANSHAERLVRLINDLLDIQKIESGKMVLALETVDLAQLIADTESENSAFASNHQVRLRNTTRAEDLLGTSLQADPDRLRQVLTNLVSNAIKFSRPGQTVDIGVSSDPTTKTVCFRVSDHGIGIPEDQIPLLFDKFHQVDGSPQRSKGGSGLGLAIVKAIVEEHGGEIRVTTELGKGSTFSVTLPAQRRTTPPPATGTDADGPPTA